MTTPTPLKLTDDVIDELFHNLCGQHEQCEAMVAAIRTLRDRARAVVDSSTRYERIEPDRLVNGEDLDALREVLP